MTQIKTKKFLLLHDGLVYKLKTAIWEIDMEEHTSV